MAWGSQKIHGLEFLILVDMGSGTFAAKYRVPSRALISDLPQSIVDADFYTASCADLWGRVVDDLEKEDWRQGLGPHRKRDACAGFRAPISYSGANYLAP